MPTSKYLNKAIDFCIETGTMFKVKYLRAGKHFADDDSIRDIYEITITRGQRSFTTEFGQSLNRSGKYIVVDRGEHKFYDKEDAVKYCRSMGLSAKAIEENPDFSRPNEYDFFATITKSDPGDFQEFCNEMGYDERPLSEYHKVMKIYEAVKREWNEIRALYSDEEIEKMYEIQ